MTSRSLRPGRTSARFARRVAILALGAAFLLAQVAGQLHRAEAAHRLCAEHGRLEHEAPAAPHAGCAAEVSQSAIADSEPRLRSDDGAGHGPDSHAACELATLLRLPQAGAPLQAPEPATIRPALAQAVPATEVRPREVRGRRDSARAPPRAV